MPSNVQALAQMADRTASQITASHESWTDFLKAAARLYIAQRAELLAGPSNGTIKCRRQKEYSL